MSTKDILYQHSDNIFRSAVRDKNGDIVLPSDFSDAEYILGDATSGAKITLTLGSGITVDGNDFVIHVDDAMIDFNGTYEHQFVVYDQAGNKLPPVFKRKVKITSVLRGQ